MKTSTKLILVAAAIVAAVAVLSDPCGSKPKPEPEKQAQS